MITIAAYQSCSIVHRLSCRCDQMTLHMRQCRHEDNTDEIGFSLRGGNSQQKAMLKSAVGIAHRYAQCLLCGRDRKRSYRRRVMTITLVPLPEVQMKELIEFTRNVGAKGCALHKPSTLIQLERRFECRSATRLKA